MDEYKINIEKGNEEYAQEKIKQIQSEDGLYAMCSCGRPWYIHAVPGPEQEIPYRRSRN